MPNNLALNVSLGAHVHKSMGKAFKDATKKSKKLGGTVSKTLGKSFESSAKMSKLLGSSLADTNRKLRTTNNVQKYREELERLKREQAEAGNGSIRFAARIKRTQAQLTTAEKQAKGYGLALGNIAREQRKLNAMSKGKRFMGSAYSGMRSGAGKAAGLATLGSSVSIGAAFAAVTGTNRSTAENELRARSLNISPEVADALGGAVREAGLETEHVLDMIEELNNKMGESTGYEEITAMTEALQVLGLEFDHIATMKPEQQLLKVIEAASQLEDGQQGRSAADKIMGGEAHKVVGYFQAQRRPISEVVEEQKRLNLVSDEGRAGAQLFNVSVNKLQTSIGSAFREISGLLGGELAPMITEWSGSIVKTFKENRVAIKDFVSSVGKMFEELPSKMGSTIEKIERIITAMDKVAGFFVKDRPKQIKSVGGTSSFDDLPPGIMQARKAELAVAAAQSQSATTAAGSAALLDTKPPQKTEQPTITNHYSVHIEGGDKSASELLEEIKRMTEFQHGSALYDLG